MPGSFLVNDPSTRFPFLKIENVNHAQAAEHHGCRVNNNKDLPNVNCKNQKRF